MQINPDSGLKNIKNLQAKRARGWDQLFIRRTGWTGADGIYSIPMSGKETWEKNSTEKTIFLFSDSFISEVDEVNRRHGTIMVNNTVAVMNGNKPDPENISFNWRKDKNNQPQAIFTPDLSYAKSGDWFWLMDGIMNESEVYIFALRLEEDSDHIFNFKILGISLISFTFDSNEIGTSYKQKDTPLFLQDESGKMDIVFGQAIMPLTVESANTNIDGFIYIYGPKGSLVNKELLAARVNPENFTDISKWCFWDGKKWTDDINASHPITTGISQEFSVSPLGNNQFIVVFLKNNKVGIRIGESPVGPFGEIKYIWDCPEIHDDPDTYVYNAKAHPHLSGPDELLISYNVNSHNLEKHYANADIYRPRFITLDLSSIR